MTDFTGLPPEEPYRTWCLTWKKYKKWRWFKRFLTCLIYGTVWLLKARNMKADEYLWPQDGKDTKVRRWLRWHYLWAVDMENFTN